MNIRLLSDRIAVKLAEENTSQGGIVLLSNESKKTLIGDVVSVGNGRFSIKGKFYKTNVNVGDRILFSKSAGFPIKINDEIFTILREKDVLAFIDRGNQDEI